jgi:hypothetical protein
MRQPEQCEDEREAGRIPAYVLIGAADSVEKDVLSPA